MWPPKALRNHPAFEEEIEEWDEPVLEYLSDIKKENSRVVVLVLVEDLAGSLSFNFTSYAQFSNVRSGKIGPAPEIFEVSTSATSRRRTLAHW